MTRLSKLVAVLTLWGVVTTPMSMLLAHSTCKSRPKDSGRGCHSIIGRQSGSLFHIQTASSTCCQFAPAVPAKITTYAVVSPAILLTTHNVASLGFALQRMSATAVNSLHPSPHCRSQAVFCTFLI